MKKVTNIQYANEIEKGSDGEESTYCGPCLRGKITKKAEIYCCECSEMLCETCTLHHGRNKYTSAHNICVIRTFNDTLKLKYLAAIEKCENHPKEEVKYLCKDHDQLCCNECAIVEHRRCATLVSIESHTELRSLEEPAKYLTKMNEYAKQLLHHETNQYTVVCDAEEAVKEKLRTLKENIEEELMRMETVLIKSAADQSQLMRNQIRKNSMAIEHFRDDLEESELKITAGEEFGQDQHKILINREMQTQNRRHATVLKQLDTNSTVDIITLTGVDQLCRDFKQSLCRCLKVERRTSVSKPAFPDALEKESLKMAKTSVLQSAFRTVLEVERKTSVSKSSFNALVSNKLAKKSSGLQSAYSADFEAERRRYESETEKTTSDRSGLSLGARILQSRLKKKMCD